MTTSKPPGNARGGPVTSSRPPETAPAPSREVSIRSVPSGTVSSRACSAPGCGRPLSARRRRFCCDTCQRRGQRAERRTETGEFGQAVVRMCRALARRVGASDIEEFGALWDLRATLDREVTAAIDGLRAKGFSWAQIAAETDLTRQGLCQWHGSPSRESGVNKRCQVAP